jgi:hypothetical protein
MTLFQKKSGFTYPNWGRNDSNRAELSKVDSLGTKSYRKDIWTLIKEEKELDKKIDSEGLLTRDTISNSVL